MRFNDIKILNEAQFNSKQEVIDHFVKQGKSAAAGAAAWERGWRGHAPKPKKPTGPVRSYHDDLDDKRYGETNEDKDPCWKNYKQVGMKKKGGKQVPNCVPKESVEEGYGRYYCSTDKKWKTRKGPKQTRSTNEAANAAQQAAIAISKKKEQGVDEDWNKVNQHDKTDGMSSKAVKAYRRENPGSKLKTAVTKKPSELKAGSKDAKRRKSFCARMSGNKGPMKDEKGRPTPKAKALSRWNCESVETLEAQLAEAAIGTAPKRPARTGSRPARGHTPVERYKKHTSPDGVETTMSPTDDDYKINYGPGGAVAKDRKARGVDVATGTHKVEEGEVYDLEKEYGYEKPKHTPRRKTVNDYPYTPEEDDEYFREIFRKKREEKAKKEKEQVKEHKKGVLARKYSTKPKGTVNHLDPKKLKKVPGRKVVGPKNIKDLEKDLHEARVEYNKKTARMELNNSDADDRHGLYLNGKLVKTYSTKEQAENMKKRSPMYKDATIKKIAESIMKQPKQQIMIEGYTEEDLIGPVPVCEFCGCHDHTSLDESGKAKRSLCLSSKPDAELGASQLSSCKAQGLRARAGGKSHKIGKSRVKVGGHRIKGKKYGGPLPDWS